jgi:hypothetical protein
MVKEVNTGTHKTEVEERGPGWGYIYVDETRMGFTVDKDEVSMFASHPAGYWPAPTASQAKACELALIIYYFNRAAKRPLRTDENND